LTPDTPKVSEKIQITIEVPFAFAQREQLLSSLESKFPGAEISIAHAEVNNPTVSEALVLHDPNSEPDSVVSGEDSESILLKATDALAAFAK
jgi:hypothetical protein